MQPVFTRLHERVGARRLRVLRARDLKGQTIETDRFNGPAMHLLMTILSKQGLDPHRDVDRTGRHDAFGMLKSGVTVARDVSNRVAVRDVTVQDPSGEDCGLTSSG